MEQYICHLPGLNKETGVVEEEGGMVVKVRSEFRKVDRANHSASRSLWPSGHEVEIACY